MTVEVIPASNNDEVLSFTQSVRHRLVTKLIGVHPVDMPDDPKVVGAINQTLDSMDRQALVLKRMDQDKKRNDDDRAAAVIIAQINQLTGKGENPFRVGAVPVQPSTDIEAELALLPVREIRPGESLIGIEDDSYDRFIERLEAE